MASCPPRVALLASLLAVAGLAGCAQGDSALSGQPSLMTAKAALSSGAPDLALNLCTSLLQRRPRDGLLMVCRSDALTALGRNAEAVSAYEAALVENRALGEAKVGLGRIALAVNPAKAEALFLDALTSNPRDPTALNDLGIARDLQGRHAEAQTAYGEAIAAAPELRAPQVNLALSMAMTGRAGEAVRIMRPIGGRPEATARERHDLAAVLAMDGKSDEAAKLLRTDLDGTQTDAAVSGFQSLPSR